MKPFAQELQHESVAIERSELPAPILTYISHRNRWRLETAYSYRDGHTTIIVPEGFVFDLSSVPRLLWWLIAPFELSVAAPLIHDFLYENGGAPQGAILPPRTYSRAQTDQLFRSIMEREGVPGWRQWVGYAAVRIFGGLAWRTPPAP